MHEPKIAIPPSSRIGDTFVAPDGQEYEVAVDGELLPLWERSDELLRAESDIQHDLGLPDRVCGVMPGQALRVRFFRESLSSLKLVRHATHYWHGVRISCPAKTSAGALDQKMTECPLCELDMGVECVWEIPVLKLGWLDQDGWHAARESEHFVPIRLRVDGALFAKFDAFVRECPNVVDWEKGREIIVRRDADWTWALELGEEHPIEKRFRRRIVGAIRLPRFRAWSDLDALVPAIRNNLKNTLEPFRLEGLRAAMPDAVFVPQMVGTKHPYVHGYPAFTHDVMEDAAYLRLLSRMNNALLCGKASNDLCTLDVDDETGTEKFKALNAWAKECQFSSAQRGGNFYFRLTGEYPQRVIRLTAGEQHWGEFRGGNGALTTLSGFHECGQPYVVQNLGVIPSIGFGDIVLPPGVAPERRVIRVQRASNTAIGQSLDLAMLENVHKTTKGTEARCPVCKLNGEDKSGNHLLIFPSGAYHCICDCDTAEIFRLAGLKRKRKGKA